jgi:hypothetical protein
MSRPALRQISCKNWEPPILGTNRKVKVVNLSLALLTERERERAGEQTAEHGNTIYLKSLDSGGPGPPYHVACSVLARHVKLIIPRNPTCIVWDHQGRGGEVALVRTALCNGTVSSIASLLSCSGAPVQVRSTDTSLKGTL